MQIHPTPTQIASALAVVQAPESCADQPGRRTLAWALLMAARGRRINQLRLCQMQRALRGVAAGPAPIIIPIRQGA